MQGFKLNTSQQFAVYTKLKKQDKTETKLKEQKIY